MKNIIIIVLLICNYLIYSDNMLTNKQLYILSSQTNKVPDIKYSKYDCNKEHKSSEICWVYSTKEQVDMVILQQIYKIVPFNYRPKLIQE